jgi:hypothetical protein
MMSVAMKVWHSIGCIQAYIASKLRSVTPGPVQGISGRLLPSHALPPAMLLTNCPTNRYFILREWVHQLQWRGSGGVDHVYRGSRLGTRTQFVDSKQVMPTAFDPCTPAGIPTMYFGDWQFYLSHIGGCTPDRAMPSDLMDSLGGSVAKWACDVLLAGIGLIGCECLTIWYRRGSL